MELLPDFDAALANAAVAKRQASEELKRLKRINRDAHRVSKYVIRRAAKGVTRIPVRDRHISTPSINKETLDLVRHILARKSIKIRLESDYAGSCESNHDYIVIEKIVPVSTA